MFLILSIILTLRHYFQKRKSVPVDLYIEALRDENAGNYEAAVVTYKNALAEFRKKKLSDNNLEERIMDKLKILHNMINYEQNFHGKNQI